MICFHQSVSLIENRAIVLLSFFYIGIKVHVILKLLLDFTDILLDVSKARQECHSKSHDSYD